MAEIDRTAAARIANDLSRAQNILAVPEIREQSIIAMAEGINQAVDFFTSSSLDKKTQEARNPFMSNLLTILARKKEEGGLTAPEKNQIGSPEIFVTRLSHAAPEVIVLRFPPHQTTPDQPRILVMRKFALTKDVASDTSVKEVLEENREEFNILDLEVQNAVREFSNSELAVGSTSEKQKEMQDAFERLSQEQIALLSGIFEVAGDMGIGYSTSNKTTSPTIALTSSDVLTMHQLSDMLATDLRHPNDARSTAQSLEIAIYGNNASILAQKMKATSPSRGEFIRAVENWDIISPEAKFKRWQEWSQNKNKRKITTPIAFTSEEQAEVRTIISSEHLPDDVLTTMANWKVYKDLLDQPHFVAGILTGRGTTFTTPLNQPAIDIRTTNVTLAVALRMSRWNGNFVKIDGSYRWRGTGNYARSLFKFVEPNLFFDTSKAQQVMQDESVIALAPEVRERQIYPLSSLILQLVPQPIIAMYGNEVSFGKILYAWRGKSGETAQAFANRFDITEDTLRRIEQSEYIATTYMLNKFTYNQEVNTYIALLLLAGAIHDIEGANEITTENITTKLQRLGRIKQISEKFTSINQITSENQNSLGNLLLGIVPESLKSQIPNGDLSFGSVLKHFMQTKNVSSQLLEELTGISARRIEYFTENSNINPLIKTAINIVNALQLTPEELILYLGSLLRTTESTTHNKRGPKRKNS